MATFGDVSEKFCENYVRANAVAYLERFMTALHPLHNDDPKLKSVCVDFAIQYCKDYAAQIGKK